VQALLAKGADVNAKATDGSTPLMFAALGHDDAIAQLLPSSPSSKDDRLDIVQALLAKGAEVDAKQEHGMTALMAAPFKGHLDVVQALLAKGADVNAKASDGTTALDAAAQGGHADIRAVLVQAHALDKALPGTGSHPKLVCRPAYYGIAPGATQPAQHPAGCEFVR
jgi:ankyrin repeat protein